MNKKIVYLDNAATTKPFPEVIERMNEINQYFFGNSSSIHSKGLEAHKIVKNSRANLAEYLNCLPEELIFTSGGSESNNAALKGIVFTGSGKKGNLVTSAYEHPTVLNTVNSFDDFGVEPRICKINEDGSMDTYDLFSKSDNDTILVSIMTVNSETGAYNAVNDLAREIKKGNERTYFHTDAVQAFGKYNLDMSAFDRIDLLSASSHKINGPKGVGLLYIRKGTNIRPLIEGGGHQGGLRSGTENTPGIAGFETAAKIYHSRQKEFYDKASELRDYLKKNIMESVDGIRFNSSDEGSPYITNIAFRDILSETLLSLLSGNNICISAGSACSSKKKRNSHVLEAINVPEEYIGGALRVSFDCHSTKEDVDEFLKETISALKILRRFRRK